MRPYPLPLKPLPPVAVEAVGHAVRQFEGRQRLVLNVFRIKDQQIAAVLLMPIDNNQQESLSLRGLRRTRHEDRFGSKAGGAEIVHAPSSGLVVIVEESVKSADIER